MSVGILILSHDGCAAQLLRHLDGGDDELVLNAMAVMINQEMTAAVLVPHLEQRLELLDTGGGVLLLCDYACSALTEALAALAPLHFLKALTGVNHAMVRTVLQHPDADLDGLAGLTLNAGRQGVQQLDTPLPT